MIPSLTFVATTNAVAYCIATPHFIDVCSRTLGVNPAKLEAYLDAISDFEAGVCINRNTGQPIRGLIGMHTFGHPFEIDEVKRVFARNSI